MAEKVHFLALAGAQAKLAETEQEYKHASQQLDEAIKLGDLRENSEYEAAKASVQRIATERDLLSPVLQLPVVKAPDELDIIQEGAVIKLTVHKVTGSPLNTTSAEFDEVAAAPPSFEGVLMFGGTLEHQELLADCALDATTPIGSFLMGKRPGRYSVQVPAGFANITVEKLKSEMPEGGLYAHHAV